MEKASENELTPTKKKRKWPWILLSIFCVMGISSYIIFALRLPFFKKKIPDQIQQMVQQKNNKSPLPKTVAQRKLKTTNKKLEIVDSTTSKSAALARDPDLEDKLQQMAQLAEDAKNETPEYKGDLSLAGMGLKKVVGNFMDQAIPILNDKLSAADQESINYLKDVTAHNLSLFLIDYVTDTETQKLIKDLSSQDKEEGSENGGSGNEKNVNLAKVVLDSLLAPEHHQRQEALKGMISSISMMDELVKSNPQAMGKVDDKKLESLSIEVGKVISKLSSAERKNESSIEEESIEEVDPSDTSDNEFNEQGDYNE